MRRLRKLLNLSWGDRFLLAEALALTGVARFAVLCLPFPWVSSWMGAAHAETPAELDTGGLSQPLISRVQWAVKSASRRTPWESKCLVQALTAESMLRRRGGCGTVYLGLAKDEDQSLKAHAWLRSGTRIVTGRRSHRSYTVVATFAFGNQITNLMKEPE